MSDAYQSPHHDDGGWHGSSLASERFDTEWQPLRDGLLVRVIPEPEHQKAIIVLPETARGAEGQRRGIVLRCGPGIWEDGRRIPLDVKPGDEIVFGRWTDWESFGKDVVLVREPDIRVIFARKENADGKTELRRKKTAAA